MIALFPLALALLESNVPELELSPSDGRWPSEEEFGPGAERPNEPSLFMVSSTTDGGV
jgi:hypothetical protein